MPTAERSRESIRVKVHEPATRASPLFRSLEPGALRAPLEDVVADLCRHMSQLLETDVVSVYVREQDEEGDLLVMRGNVGLASEVVGNLGLRVGDGIAGWVAECLRPISLAAADQDPRFKAVRGIGEERFPVYFAQPLLRGRLCLGVLVLQRAARRPFEPSEVRLAGVLAEALALVLEAAGRRGKDADSGTEAVSLLGRPMCGGLGIGRLELIPTVEALSSKQRVSPGPDEIERALSVVQDDLARLRGELSAPPDEEPGGALGKMALLLSDERLRERLLHAPGGDLARLAREYARAPRRLALPSQSPDRVLLERAEEVGELCALLQVIVTGGRLLQNGRVWIGRRLGGFFALAAARRAAAVVLDGDGRATADALAIARAARVPLVIGVRGLFAWTQPDDLLVVDADRSVVRINPSSSGVVAARSERLSREGSKDRPGS